MDSRLPLSQHAYVYVQQPDAAAAMSLFRYRGVWCRLQLRIDMLAAARPADRFKGQPLVSTLLQTRHTHPTLPDGRPRQRRTNLTHQPPSPGGAAKGDENGRSHQPAIDAWLPSALTAQQGEPIRDPPELWTTDPEQMKVDYYWGPNGVGTGVAKSYGLSDPTGLMVRTVDSGGGGYMFTAGGRFYLWNMVADQVFEYTEPTTLAGILTEMKKLQGKGKVKRRELESTQSPV